MNLSPRQTETLRHMADGMSIKQVARHSNIATDTVKKCLIIVRLKMGARTTAHAVALAKDSGLL